MSYINPFIKMKMSLPYFILIAAVTVFLYFEVMTQVWFLGLIGGYVIKVWVPPLLLFFCILTKKMIIGEDFRKIKFTNLILVLYAMFGFIAMLTSEESLHLAIKYYLIMIAPVWFYVVIIENFKDNRDIELMIKILIICGFLLSIYIMTMQLGDMQSSTGITREIITNTGTKVELSEAIYAERSWELSTEWTEYSRGLNTYEVGKYSGMLAPSILFSILLFFQSKKRIKYLYLAIVSFLFYQIINTVSRSALASLVLGIVVLMYILYRNEKRIRTKIVITSFCFFMVSAFYVIAFKMIVVRRFLQLFNFLKISDLATYLQMYGLGANSIEFADLHITSIGESLSAFYQRPLLGAGYVFTEQVINEHNRYLFILVSSGLLTLIPYIFFFGVLIFLTRKAMINFSRLKSNKINYGYFFYACGIMFLFKLLNEGMETFYYWIFFAFASAWIRNCKREVFDSKK